MMKLFATLLFCSLAWGQDAAAPEPKKVDLEQQELNQAIAEAGNSNVDFTRALENHLKKYPNSTQKVAIERALVKAAIEAKDDKRIIQYGELALAQPPMDLQVTDQLLRSLLRSDGKEVAVKALVYAAKYLAEIERIGKTPAGGRFSEAQWKDEIEKGKARAYVYEARATGNQDKFAEAVELARKSWEMYPNAAAGREIGRWYAKLGMNMEAVQSIADAFTIADPLATETERGRDRIRMGELYQKATGGEKGLGDVILLAYDRTHALMSERAAKLKAADPNLQASKITDFTLEAIAGGKLSLASLHGKTVVMDFWATWCGPCKVQHPLYDKVQQSFKDNHDVVFLAVSTDEDRELVAPVLKERKWSTENVFYEAGIATLLDISSIPTCIIVDKNGNIASRMNGFAPERFVDLLTERINAAMKN
jgi:thiol-disulfide isomerase/thioredoxin/plasmid stabilization system protein ParE